MVPALHVEQEKADREGVRARSRPSRRRPRSSPGPARHGDRAERFRDIRQFVSRSELVELLAHGPVRGARVFVFGGKIAEVGGDDEISILDVPRLQSLLTGRMRPGSSGSRSRWPSKSP